MNWSCFLDVWFLHLFELDQTFFTADGFTAVLQPQQEPFVEADGAADGASKHGQVVGFVVVDEADVAANPVQQSIHGQLELTLRMTKEHEYVTAG